MKKYKITAANKEHFESLIQDYQNNGFKFIRLKDNLAKLETKSESITIEY